MPAMSLLSSSIALSANPRPQLLSGSSVKPSGRFLGGLVPINKSLPSGSVQLHRSKRSLAVQAAYGSDGRPSSSSIFVGGFILGGIIVGTLGCVFAPKVSQALAGTDHKDLMRKLPSFIYDEEKALERTRKILEKKIEKLNSAIDKASAHLRTDDEPNGAIVNPDEVEAAA